MGLQNNLRITLDSTEPPAQLRRSLFAGCSRCSGLHHLLRRVLQPARCGYQRLGGGTYVGELTFNLLVLVGAVKGCDRIVKEIMGL